MMALVDTDTDRILGFTVFGVGAGKVIRRWALFAPKAAA
jgi:pyruvate/2-oxoglutarate dehydrogenase complex dihydrolipoamide dehydrogenase (E3) component